MFHSCPTLLVYIQSIFHSIYTIIFMATLEEL
jgi:hypothetical protein